MWRSYLFLVLAIVLEVVGTSMMKLSEGFTRLVPSVLIFVTYVASTAFLTLALKGIDLGYAYAIWSGLGTAMIMVIGVVIYHEPVTAIKLVSVFLIVAGVVGLNLSGGGH